MYIYPPKQRNLMNRLYRSATLLFTFILIAGIAKAGSIEKKLRKKIPSIVKIEAIEHDAHFKSAWDIRITQMLDHNDPSKGTFEHRLFLKHYNFKSPMVFVTAGYTGSPRTRELSKVLKSNQLVCEFRYFGESKPEELDWTYLSNSQAIEDLHTIAEQFKKVYKGKWVATGTSKGGTTCLFYKATYPDDMVAWVPYVAPMPVAQEDKRCDDHIRTIGDEVCREKLFAYQKRCLELREEIMPMVEEEVKKKEWTFEIGVEAAYEYAVLEYTFSFWQYAHDCDEVPDRNASAAEVFEHLNEVVGFSLYCDQGVKFYAPAFYLFWKENGYYGFITDHLQDQLKAVKKPSNGIFAPQDADLTYNSAYMEDALVKLKKNGNNIIYIYGEYDTWTACGVYPDKNTNSLRMDKKKGSHTTRIKTFSKAEQEQIYAKLREWVGTEVYPIGK